MAASEEHDPMSPQSPPSFFPKIQFKFPFLNHKPKLESDDNLAKPETTESGGGGEAEDRSVARVSFPYSHPKFVEPLEAEAEFSSGRTSNSVVLWQVYALGGFLVLRWVWARWNERKERRNKKDKPEGDDEIHPADEN
ncbi:PREDICTED: uncharacterized protein LOC104823559 [Tarenaya hassleriana]|uniref:uncharacterized protein LOC104823559 n=1 Tax=Tarenaya hassleriana TaxID=28532 RepID=UPI00053C3613|nr:PREDICTED: uncharacterized protein LOC104823559 [Tarenaya hassleriana]